MEYLKQKAVSEQTRSHDVFVDIFYFPRVFLEFTFLLFMQEREEAYQRELEMARVEKEKEIARLRAQQERAKDKQAEKVLFQDSLTLLLFRVAL